MVDMAAEAVGTGPAAAVAGTGWAAAGTGPAAAAPARVA